MKHHLHHSIGLLLVSVDNFLSEMTGALKCAAVMQCEMQYEAGPDVAAQDGWSQ